MSTLLNDLIDVEQADTVTGLTLISGRFPAGEHDRVWRAWRAEHARTGWWPVLGWSAGEAVELSRAWDRWNGAPQGQALLDELRDVDPAGRVAEIVQGLKEWWTEDAEFDAEAVVSAAAALPREPRRPSSRATPSEVLLVPATAGYEVLAHVPWILPVMSNWVGGPSHPNLLYSDHLLTLRHWEERWGAEFYYGRGSNLELEVSRPPRDPLAVAACAIEQFSYCDDLIQILGDTAEIARYQAPGTHWRFWWD
ncbi:DUF4253 domain-containing protein [Actinoplanes sp. G11-F43]|uniref:DUF4253 domain-containing protein n=1 Tax=Actinoplanes sp. G11-F43 TaxID=3424130 RepID=UPI003D33AD56